MNWMDIRIDQSYDMYVLIEGRKLTLGGVEIPYTCGLLGHSGADASLHATTDALFGVAGLGDIGRHFPDTDPVFVDADDRMLLHEAMHRMYKAGYMVGNVDITVIAQEPKFASYVPGMMTNFTKDLGIVSEQCNVKVKANEKLGFEGKEEGTITQMATLIHHVEGADQD